MSKLFLIALLSVVCMLMCTCGAGSGIDNPTAGSNPEIVLLPEINRMVPAPEVEVLVDTANPLPPSERYPTNVSYQQGPYMVSMASTVLDNGTYRIQFGIINNSDETQSIFSSGFPFPDLYLRNDSGVDLVYYFLDRPLQRTTSRFLQPIEIKLEPAESTLWEAFVEPHHITGNPQDYYLKLHWAIPPWPDMYVALDD